MRQIYYLYKLSQGDKKTLAIIKYTEDWKIVLRDDANYRYDVQELLGKWSLGQVIKCF